MMSSEVIFVLGDKLPWVSEAVLAIYNFAPGGSAKQNNETKQRKIAVNAYVKALIEMWSKAFGKENILERKAVASKIRNGLALYFNKVCCNRRSKISKRERIKQWRLLPECNQLLDILKKTTNPELFDADEKTFYYEQKKVTRIGYLSEQIDEDFEKKKEIQEKDQEFRKKEDEEIQELYDEMEIEANNSGVFNSTFQFEPLVSINRSGLVRLDHEDHEPVERPSLRKVSKTFTKEVKSACANVSSKCGISAEKARIAVKTVCKEMYQHNYYLNVEEYQSQEQPNNQISEEPKTKVPKTSSDYDNSYKYVLPSAKTILKYKHLQATQEETDAGITLHSMQMPTKVTLHYDTTSRCNIDGDWPCLLLNFSNGKCFRLRPLHFAYEDRENIVRLVTETYERLAIATGLMIAGTVTAKHLWEKTNHIMTDSVTKNLKIEELIAEKLGSEHVPYHLLCKSHVVEKLDASNLNVLASLETEVKLRQRLEAVNPSLRSFFRGKKAVVVAGIQAILKLISHDRSGNTTSLAEEFDYIIEREGQVKHMSLYHERRFTKLGYSAASILQALPLLNSLLEETWKSNLLVQSCKIYLECEWFLTELHLLAYFTYKITLPFLNCVEKSNQEELLHVLPKLYEDLMRGNPNTLQDYIVEFKHIQVEDLASQLEKDVFNLMCKDAASGIKLQCGREYGFDSDGCPPRAAELFKLDKEVLKDMPTNNINAERDLAKFSHLAVVAKFRNKNFTAKGIRNDIVLFNSTQSGVTTITNKIHKLLTNKEVSWTQNQKKLQEKRIEMKMKKSKTEQGYTTKLLQACKSWGGPCTTVNELETILSRRSDISAKIVKTELAYYRNTHQGERHETPELFKLIKISHEERLENLFVLLNSDTRVCSKNATAILDLPTNEELVQIILKNVSPENPNEGPSIADVNELCVVVWDVANEISWFIGYVIEKVDKKCYTVEHLHRVPCSQHDFWNYPHPNDIQEVSEDQILPCKIEGEWKATANTATRIDMRFHLKNSAAIDNTFKKLMNM